ncbi:hypothetical protein ACUSIJ_17800 [Pseudochelatococcus sp. B33]
MTNAPATRRRHIPVGVKLHAVLLRLGFTDEEIRGGINWDHNPPLALRRVDPETGLLVPEANDPHFIQPLRKSGHDTKTFGRGGEKRITTAGGDIHAIAKSKRLARGSAEFDRRLIAKSTGEEPRPERRRKRRIPSRPFSQRKST